jgi:hypothetical protein
LKDAFKLECRTVWCGTFCFLVGYFPREPTFFFASPKEKVAKKKGDF